MAEITQLIDEEPMKVSLNKRLVPEFPKKYN